MSQGSSTVGVIYTGGTFGMVASRDGYVPTTDLPERASAALDASGERGLPAVEWLDNPAPPVDSGSIVPQFWFDLAQTIAVAADRYDGFVVIHGTDTLAFTGSALSFLLAGLGRPVVVTGASRPLGEAGSDALDNLVNALRVAAAGECDEVTLAFGEQLLRANRATKRHGSAGTPFSSPALGPLATLGERIEWQGIDPPPGAGEGNVPAATWRESAVAFLSIYPGITGDVVRAVRDTGVGALVLEGYSAGIGPGGDAGFRQRDRGHGGCRRHRGRRVAESRGPRATRQVRGQYAAGRGGTRRRCRHDARGGDHQVARAAVAGAGRGNHCRRFGRNLRGELTPEP
ncbi:MAG: asparaginase domain-containing protein [Halofilum sp. (in: g-proteobacteria)]|nr:asparaginase domain-containing protein [Halofilum sp. (in: g-proteobacteria)]